MQTNDQIRKSITVRGLSGLQNQGNTCYMNAVLQCLSNTELFCIYILNKNFADQLKENIICAMATKKRKRYSLDETEIVELDKKDIIENIKHNSIIYNLYKLFGEMWKDNNEIAPISFKKALGKYNSMFDNYRQQDSQELLNCILDAIHEELKVKTNVRYKHIPQKVKLFREKIDEFKELLKDDRNKINTLIRYKKFVNEHTEEYIINASMEYWSSYLKNGHSIIRDMFAGITYTATCCDECKITSLAFEPFIMLPISIPDTKDGCKLETCFINYNQENILSGQEKYQCDNCVKLCDAQQKTYLWEPPHILIIHLKRFINIMFGNHCHTKKVDTKITFPLKNLDVSSITSEYSIDANNKLYNLYGVVCQSGNLNSGHYFAYCKNTINKKWYRFNDSHVEHITDDKIENEITNDAYILFYEKTQDGIEIEMPED